VDVSGETPKLYKPVILASVLNAIRSGELTENRISFSWAANCLVEKGKSIGTDFSMQNAADGFVRMSREPFWLLCYAEPENGLKLIEQNRITPSNVHKFVTHAMLREPFWEALQSTDNCSRVLSHLEKTRLPHAARIVEINKELFASAVDQTIRPYLIDKGCLNDPKSEGYHHKKVIPNAQPFLTQDSLNSDAVGNIKAALKARANLLSQYEYIRPKSFLDVANPEEVRDRCIDLLYGSDDLKTRLVRFFDWGDYHKGSDGSTIGFNATTASYLLAVSNPQQYAFCKPSVYKAAAKALLGSDKVITDPTDRICHATDFYKAALALFVDPHELPFTDLMHSHIAFYVMKQGFDNLPTWEKLQEESNGTKINEPLMTTNSNDLNVALYGPPGTGKTYHAISRAVQICDGKLSADRKDIAERFKALRSEGQIEFVTFHQSYGYEDFVEGIRPVLGAGDETGSENQAAEVQYECRDGVLKRICSLAMTKETKRIGRFKLDPTQVRAWKMSLGNTLNPDHDIVYDECIENSCILLGYGRDIDFAGCDTKTSIEEMFRVTDPNVKNTDYNITAVNAFKNKMQVGDLVVISDGNHKFRAIGKVSGGYQLADRDSYRQMRPVEWLVVYEESLPREKISKKEFSQQTIYRLKSTVLKMDALKEILIGDVKGVQRNYVLIIDEINRGNIAKILGELITLLEPDKRLKAANELKVTLPYSGEQFGVPQNLFVIGTMNTADRSIAFLDTALRRRFNFVEMMPDGEVIRSEVGDDGVLGDVDTAEILEAINSRIELLYDRDHQIGHSYFIDVQSFDDLKRVFLAKVIPLLQEYFYGDWGKVCTILGCPYNSETGEPLNGNNKPLIKASLLRVSELPGGEQEDFEDKIRCFVNPDFEKAVTDGLVEFFQGVISAT